MVDFAQLGQRLQTALEDSGLTLEDLGRKASVEAEVLRTLIAGLPAKVSTGTLARIAREVGIDPTGLWTASRPDDVRLSVHFRNAGIPDFFAADLQVLRRAIKEALEVRALNDALGSKPPLGDAWFEPEAVGAVPYEDGYRRARQVRSALHAKDLLGHADDPIGDIDGVVEDAFGISVLEADLRAGSVLALTVKDTDTGSVAIVINRSSSYGLTPLRRRVDIAHELAHALFDASPKPLGLWIDESTDIDSDEVVDRIEQRARAFAAELLLPIQGLRKLFGNPAAGQPTVQGATDLVHRARTHFGTTAEIATNHLANNGYFPKQLREAVKQQLPAAEQPTSARRRRLLERRVREAVARGLMTRMRARELLSLSAWDVLAEA